jgi:PAS domain S-box-containing protein
MCLFVGWFLTPRDPEACMRSPEEPPVPPADPLRVEEQSRSIDQELIFHVENSPLAVIEWDHDLRVVRWSGQAEKVFGWTAAEVQGKRVFDWPFVHESDADAVRGLLAGTRVRPNTHSVLVCQNLTKAGTVIWCEWHNSVLTDPLGEVVSIQSLVLDVTDRKKAEATFRGLLDAFPDAMVIANPAGEIVLVNAQTERLFGFTRGELLGRPVDLLFPNRFRETPPAFWTDFFREPRTGQLMAALDLFARRKDGTEFPVEISLSPLEAPDGLLVSSSFRDITDRKTAAEALADGEARLRAALSSAQMLGWDWDLTTGRSNYSGDYASFFRLPADRDYTVGGNAWQAVHPDDIPWLDPLLHRVVQTGEDLNFEYRGRIPRADGVIRWFATRGQVFRGAGGKPARVVAVTTDITDRKLAEREREAFDKQLLDAQKWESLGVLAGGVAHDFNNILTVILGNAGLAARVLPEGSTAGPFLEQIEQACRRAADLCRQMLACAGRGPVPTGRTDLNRLIRDTAPLLEVPASRHTRTRFELAEGLPAVQADAAQVRQVLLNLVMNAAEAIGEAGGDVVIRTGLVDVAGDDPDTTYRLPPVPGRYIELSVADTGPGIAEAVQARMFDPFFTTKFPGRGLGLAAVLGIVRSHRGAIRLETAPGLGTTLAVLLPPAGMTASGSIPRATTRQAGSLTQVSIPGVAPIAVERAGLALVIDDEMYIREVAASTLEELGFEPVLAGDGPAGLDLFRRHRDLVRVAVIDMVMPGVPGDKVLEELRAEMPSLPAVLVSGYVDRRLTRSGAPTEFVQKPFHPDELAAALRRVVGIVEA